MNKKLKKRHLSFALLYREYLYILFEKRKIMEEKSFYQLPNSGSWCTELFSDTVRIALATARCRPANWRPILGPKRLITAGRCGKDCGGD
jgi:hypothetical protein